MSFSLAAFLQAHGESILGFGICACLTTMAIGAQYYPKDPQDRSAPTENKRFAIVALIVGSVVVLLAGALGIMIRC